MAADAIAVLPRLDVLFETVGPPPPGSPTGDLDEAYGGSLALPGEIVYANFVTSIDGVAADRARPRSSRDISGGDATDRFVMGLLRANADAVLIGAGTLWAHPAGDWTPERAYPAAAGTFAALRSANGKAPRPQLVVVSGSGRIPSHPALRDSIVFTTTAGARRFSPDTADLADVRIAQATGEFVDVMKAIDTLRLEGFRGILTEGGPRLMGALVRAHAIDELFLTVSPLVAGRDETTDRPGIVDGLQLGAEDLSRAALVSVRRSGSFLFLRYRMT